MYNILRKIKRWWWLRGRCDKCLDYGNLPKADIFDKKPISYCDCKAGKKRFYDEIEAGYICDAKPPEVKINYIEQGMDAMFMRDVFGIKNPGELN